MLREDDQDESIFIIKYDKQSEYTTIFNDCLNDENLSTDSVAILVYVMSKPIDWKINIKNISNRYKIGRDKVRSSVNNLIEFGYVKRVRQRKKDGSLSKILIYASDKPIFLLDKSPRPENQEVVVTEHHDKQPRPEIQAMVTEESSNKQPRPEKPALVNQAVDTLYVQKKELNKENNNNKITTNPKGACATSFSYELNNVYPEASVVVFFMKKIEGSGVPESTMIGWLRKHGTDYVSEKIRIYQTKGALANPGGFLSSAMAYDWKEKAQLPSPKEPAACNLPKYPTLDENKAWFVNLTDSEKNGLEQLALLKHTAFSEMLTNAKLTVLDEIFPESFLFKMMMELLCRAKR